jgi:antitoxin component YwqK of YwqJK toxin-antitoxin module
MKRLTLLFCLLPWVATFAQKTLTTYYDWEKKHVHEVYGTDSYGTKNGTYTEYSQNGGILVQGKYNKDTKVGKWIANDEKGRLELEENFDNDGKDNGQVKRYVNGYLYAIENYKHGDRYGQWKTWYLGNGTGNDETASDGIYLNSEGKTQLHIEEYYKPCPQRYEPGVGMLNWGLDSIRKEYDLKGVLIRTVNYKNNLGNGKATYYDQDGSGDILSQGTFQNDTLRGEWKISYDAKWNKTFHKASVAFYSIENIAPDGSMKSMDYYVTGEKQGERVYDKDKMLSGTYYYRDGKVMKKETFNPGTGKYDTVEYNEDGFIKQ